MEFIIRVEARLAGKIVETRDIAKITRVAAGLGAEELGLTLEDGKDILRHVQDRLVKLQVEFIQAAAAHCMHCGRKKSIKDKRSRSLRTVFGAVSILCRRYIFCTCRGGKPRAEWPLRNLTGTYNSPEFRYLLAKWGSDMPYRRAAALLGELLPLPNGRVSHSAVRRQTIRVGERFDQRAVEPAEYDWPISNREPVVPSPRLTVAIDETYIRADLNTCSRQHQVIAGRIDRDGELGSHFAWIAGGSSAQRHMRASLEDQGLTKNSTIAVLADGAGGLGTVVAAAATRSPRSILDWFHISMRLRHIEQMAPSMAVLFRGTPVEKALKEKLPNIRHQMWHGQGRAAVARMCECYQGTRDPPSMTSEERKRVDRFRQHLIDLRDYLGNNGNDLTDYGKAKRDGLRISSAPAESGMNHLINQRMGKRQQMRWSAAPFSTIGWSRCFVSGSRGFAALRQGPRQWQRNVYYPHTRSTSPCRN